MCLCVCVCVCVCVCARACAQLLLLLLLLLLVGFVIVTTMHVSHMILIQDMRISEALGKNKFMWDKINNIFISCY